MSASAPGTSLPTPEKPGKTPEKKKSWFSRMTSRSSKGDGAAKPEAEPSETSPGVFSPGQDPNYDYPQGVALEIPTGVEPTGDKPTLPSEREAAAVEGEGGQQGVLGAISGAASSAAGAAAGAAGTAASYVGLGGTSDKPQAEATRTPGGSTAGQQGVLGALSGAASSAAGAASSAAGTAASYVGLGGASGQPEGDATRAPDSAATADVPSTQASPFPPGKDPNYDYPEGVALEIPTGVPVTSEKPVLPSERDAATDAPTDGQQGVLGAISGAASNVAGAAAGAAGNVAGAASSAAGTAASYVGLGGKSSPPEDEATRAPGATPAAEASTAQASPFPPGKDPNYDYPEAVALEIPTGVEVTSEKPTLPSERETGTGEAAGGQQGVLGAITGAASSAAGAAAGAAGTAASYVGLGGKPQGDTTRAPDAPATTDAPAGGRQGVLGAISGAASSAAGAASSAAGTAASYVGLGGKPTGDAARDASAPTATQPDLGTPLGGTTTTTTTTATMSASVQSATAFKSGSMRSGTMAEATGVYPPGRDPNYDYPQGAAFEVPASGSGTGDKPTLPSERETADEGGQKGIFGAIAGAVGGAAGAAAAAVGLGAGEKPQGKEDTTVASSDPMPGAGGVRGTAVTPDAPASPFPPGRDPNYDYPEGVALEIPTGVEVTSEKPTLPSERDAATGAPSGGQQGVLGAISGAASSAVGAAAGAAGTAASYVGLGGARDKPQGDATRAPDAAVTTDAPTGGRTGMFGAISGAASSAASAAAGAAGTAASYVGLGGGPPQGDATRAATSDTPAAQTSPFPPGKDPNYDYPEGVALEIPTGVEVTGEKPVLPSESAAAAPSTAGAALTTGTAGSQSVRTDTTAFTPGAAPTYDYPQGAGTDTLVGGDGPQLSSTAATAPSAPAAAVLVAGAAGGASERTEPAPGAYTGGGASMHTDAPEATAAQSSDPAAAVLVAGAGGGASARTETTSYPGGGATDSPRGKKDKKSFFKRVKSKLSGSSSGRERGGDGGGLGSAGGGGSSMMGGGGSSMMGGSSRMESTYTSSQAMGGSYSTSQTGYSSTYQAGGATVRFCFVLTFVRVLLRDVLLVGPVVPPWLTCAVIAQAPVAGSVPYTDSGPVLTGAVPTVADDASTAARPAGASGSTQPLPGQRESASTYAAVVGGGSAPLATGDGDLGGAPKKEAGKFSRMFSRKSKAASGRVSSSAVATGATSAVGPAAYSGEADTSAEASAIALAAPGGSVSAPGQASNYTYEKGDAQDVTSDAAPPQLSDPGAFTGGGTETRPAAGTGFGSSATQLESSQGAATGGTMTQGGTTQYESGTLQGAGGTMTQGGVTRYESGTLQGTGGTTAQGGSTQYESGTLQGAGGTMTQGGYMQHESGTLQGTGGTMTQGGATQYESGTLRGTGGAMMVQSGSQEVCTLWPALQQPHVASRLSSGRGCRALCGCAGVRRRWRRIIAPPPHYIAH